MIKSRITTYIAAGLITLTPLTVSAQSLTVIPMQGQSPDQIAKDRSECHASAVRLSNYDPTTGASTAPSSGQTGSVGKETLRGGMRGAAAGAAIGAIAGDAGKGAAIGATAGGLKRGFGQVDRSRESQSSANSSGEANYNQAFGACMMGRGYSIQ